MGNERPLVLIPQGCCDPSPAVWARAFVDAGRPADNVFAGDQKSTTTTVELTSVEGHTGRSFLRTTSHDSGFLMNLYQAQLWLEANHKDNPCDVVVVVCCPPPDAAGGAMTIVIQLTADGHRVHSLMPNCVNSNNRRLARQMAAAGIWHHYSLDHPEHVEGVDKALRAIEESRG